MMNRWLCDYADFFNYVITGKPNVYTKKLGGFYMTLELDANPKYVNFYYKEKKKIFKQGDLALCVLEGMPVCHEEELYDSL